jgi:polysaccharide biosynthesis/export protein
MKTTLLYVLLMVLMSACTHRNLTYLSDLEDSMFLDNQQVFTEKVQNHEEPRIQPDDLINISVTSLNPESNFLFNKGEIIPVVNAANYNSPGMHKEGYLVDKEGYIDFPVLGRIKVGGMSKAEVKDKLTKELQQYLKSPIVNIKYLNYKITVIGEVKNPSTFTIPTERINIFEALGLAGDMTPFGKRENVLIIREVDGVREITRINLNSSQVLNSPYFYLKQNDVLYVEPDKARADQASTTRNNISMGLSVASLLVILITRLR